DRRRSAGGESGDERTGNAGELPANQRDDHRVGAWRTLGEREQLRELGARHPAFDIDDDAMNLGQDRIDAADGNERQRCEAKRDFDEDFRVTNRSALPRRTCAALTALARSRATLATRRPRPGRSARRSPTAAATAAPRPPRM